MPSVTPLPQQVYHNLPPSTHYPTMKSPPFVSTFSASKPCTSQLPASLTQLIPLHNAHPMTTHANTQINKPKMHTNGTIRYPLPKALLNIASSVAESTCFTQANKVPEWCQAIDTELTALIKNGTWSLVPPNP